jgi:hypothetical protein
MKAKKIYILIIGMLLTMQVFATQTTFKDKNDVWLQRSESSGRPGITDGDVEPETPIAPTAPVGDALGIILTLTLIYGAYSLVRKKSTEK